MLKRKLAALAIVVGSTSVLAQQPPTGGSQMLQIPPVPAPETAPPAIDIEQGVAPTLPAPAGESILVNSLKITGAVAYSDELLVALTGFQPGSQQTLADLRRWAKNIADYYRSHGYFVAQAYLPAQDIKDGAVTIAVIEGHYGKITINNQTNLSDERAASYFAGLGQGDPVVSGPLENRLLLLSDLPGVNVKSTLVPGASVGTSDLTVDLTPGRRISGSVDFDNAGNRYTGEYRLGATINLNEPLGLGDVASLRVMTSGPGMHYARASYQMQFGKATAGVAYSVLDYTLGREFASLRAHGTVNIATVYGSYPLIRTRTDNLTAGLAYDDKTFKDYVDSTSSVTDKKAQVLTASLHGSHRDSFGGGGATSYSLNWATGEIDIQTRTVRAIDALTAKSNGHFDKLGFSLSRAQRLTDTVSLSASINGQMASKNLDSSEKMGLGGMYGVRSYPEGEGYGDEGYVATLELRKQLPKLYEAMPGRMSLIGFVDSGSVTINKNPWAAGTNSRSLSGAGVGFNWFDTDNFSVKAYYAWKLGTEKATSSPDAPGRFWIQLVKYF